MSPNVSDYDRLPDVMDGMAKGETEPTSQRTWEIDLDDWDPRVDSAGSYPHLHVPALRDVAIYLSGLGVASIIMVVFWLNPSWPAWTGGVAVVVAAVAGVIATQPESR